MRNHNAGAMGGQGSPGARLGGPAPTPSTPTPPPLPQPGVVRPYVLRHERERGRIDERDRRGVAVLLELARSVEVSA